MTVFTSIYEKVMGVHQDISSVKKRESISEIFRHGGVEYYLMDSRLLDILITEAFHLMEFHNFTRDQAADWLKKRLKEN